jgi:hypothetical protein
MSELPGSPIATLVSDTFATNKTMSLHLALDSEHLIELLGFYQNFLWDLGFRRVEWSLVGSARPLRHSNGIAYLHEAMNAKCLRSIVLIISIWDIT